MFVECKNSIAKNQLGDLVDLYSTILNSSPEPKNPKLIIIGDRFRFVTLSEEKFFGFKEIEIDHTTIRMAEPEKAVIDSIDKLGYGGGLPEVVAVVYHSYGKIDKWKLVSYAKKMNSHSLCQKLGFVLDFLGSKEYIVPDEKLLLNLKSSIRSTLGQ